jgi:hypothetical protein
VSHSLFHSACINYCFGGIGVGEWLGPACTLEESDDLEVLEVLEASSLDIHSCFDGHCTVIDIHKLHSGSTILMCPVYSCKPVVFDPCPVYI